MLVYLISQAKTDSCGLWSYTINFESLNGIAAYKTCEDFGFDIFLFIAYLFPRSIKNER